MSAFNKIGEPSWHICCSQRLPPALLNSNVIRWGPCPPGRGGPVAILNRNEPAFYCIPAKAYEALMDKLEDLELNAMADARAGQKEIAVTLDEL